MHPYVMARTTEPGPEWPRRMMRRRSVPVGHDGGVRDGSELKLPCSRSAMDRLGERLAVPGALSDEDENTLSEILLTYDNALALVEGRARVVVDAFEEGHGVSLALTTRVKTNATIREKLRRESSMGFKGMVDIAGMRLSGDINRLQQDRLAKMLADEFSDDQRPARIVDRRARPSSGYRAVHVVVHVAGLPVEIQLRTLLQDAWAQLVEKLGDTWGRAIRYGGEPESPTLPVYDDDGAPTRGDFMAIVMKTSDTINSLERLAAQDDMPERELASLLRGDLERPDLDESDRMGLIQDVRDGLAETRLERQELAATLHEYMITMTELVEEES